MKMNRQMRRWGGLILLAASWSGCEKSGPSAGPGAAQAPAPPPAAVTVTPPVAREVVEWDEYQGRMDAVEMVEVRARVGGYLDAIHFKDGAMVQKGDLLFTIDPRPYQADLDRATAELAQARTKYELASNDMARGQRLLASRAISVEEVDLRNNTAAMAAAAIASAQASVETAQLNVNYTKVTAPIAGRIGRRLVTEGNLINATPAQSSTLTTIVSLDPVYCYFDADERSIIKYQQMARDGQGDNIRDGKVPCELALAGETNFPHAGTLDFVDNHVDPSTGTMRVRAVFPNPDHVLQPGFFARVRVPGTPRYPALLVPDQAVGTDQGQKFVLTVDPQNLVQYKIVSLGPLLDGLRVVRTGLTSNDLVIVNGLMGARPGAKVNPARATDPVSTNAPAR